MKKIRHPLRPRFARRMYVARLPIGMIVLLPVRPRGARMFLPPAHRINPGPSVKFRPRLRLAEKSVDIPAGLVILVVRHILIITKRGLLYRNLPLA